jgi:hypothetical protein
MSVPTQTVQKMAVRPLLYKTEFHCNENADHKTKDVVGCICLLPGYNPTGCRSVQNRHGNTCYKCASSPHFHPSL